MSSIIEAAEEVVQDKGGVLKCILYAIPIFASYVLYKMEMSSVFYIFATITVIFLLTVTKIILNNVRSCKDYVHPKTNIINFIGESIKLFFIMLPICSVGGGIGYALSNIQIPIPHEKGQLIYQIIVWSILGSMMLTSFIFYAKTSKFKEAYNFSGIFTYCTDIFVTTVFGLPRLALLDLATLGVVTYIFHFFFGLDNYFYAFACSVTISMNIAILAHFLAQVDYETVKHDENEEDGTKILDTF